MCEPWQMDATFAYIAAASMWPPELCAGAVMECMILPVPKSKISLCVELQVSTIVNYKCEMNREQYIIYEKRFKEHKLRELNRASHEGLPWSFTMKRSPLQGGKRIWVATFFTPTIVLTACFARSSTTRRRPFPGNQSMR